MIKSAKPNPFEIGDILEAHSREDIRYLVVDVLDASRIIVAVVDGDIGKTVLSHWLQHEPWEARSSEFFNIEEYDKAEQA